MQPAEDKITISGPISAYCYELEGRRFFFFGDEHYSTDRGCGELYSKRCDHMNYTFTSVTKYQSSCWTILALFEEWFGYNKRNGKKTDFYIELPYHKSATLGNIYDSAMTEINSRRLGKRPPALRDMSPEERSKFRANDPVNKIGWLGMTTMRFEDCLVKDKNKCSFGPEVRMHYADVRQFLIPETEVGRRTGQEQFDYFSLGGRMLRKTYKSVVDHLLNDDFGVAKTKEIVLTLLNMIDEYYVMAELIATNMTEFFELYISPDGYEKHHKNLLDLIPTETAVGEQFKLNLEGVKLLTKVTPSGKRMHRAAAELLRLSDSEGIQASILQFSSMYVGNAFQRLREQLEAFEIQFAAAEEIKRNIEREDRLSKENLLLFLDLFNEKFKYILRAIDTSAVVIGANIMDVYTLARMFILKDSEDVVVFAGDAHISSYVLFFTEYLGATNIYYHPSEVNRKGQRLRCVEISELPSVLDLEGFRQ